MMIFFLLFSLLTDVLTLNFTVSLNQNKLLAWTNNQGIQEKLLISQIQLFQTTTLVQKSTLSYSYLVDQNCEVTQQILNATIYQKMTSKKYQLEYAHMQGNDVVSKNTVQFKSNAQINLNDQYVIKFSSNSDSSITNSDSQNSLYLFDNQTLIQFDSKIYSTTSQCYMLSRMTKSMCLQQNCYTLPPSQLFQMQIGRKLTNFSVINQQIVLTNINQANLTQILQIELRSFNQNGQLDEFEFEVMDQIVNISGNNKITVNFELQNSNRSSIAVSNNLRGVSSGQSNNSVKIVLQNPQTSYVIKNIKIYKGSQLTLTNKIMFKPLQQVNYYLLWNNDQQQIPSVEVYNENMQLQNRYTMQNYIDFQYNEANQIQSQSEDIIPATQLQDINVTQSKQNILPFILAAVGGGIIFVLILVLYCCRKRIMERIFEKKTIQEKKESKEQQPQCDKKQSGRQFNHPYQITFENRTPKIYQINSASTQDRSSRSTPQDDLNTNQCSIENHVQPVQSFQVPQSQDIPQSNQVSAELGPIQFIKRQKPFYEQISISNSQSQSQNNTKLKFQRKQRKEQKGESTQNI